MNRSCMAADAVVKLGAPWHRQPGVRHLIVLCMHLPLCVHNCDYAQGLSVVITREFGAQIVLVPSLPSNETLSGYLSHNILYQYASTLMA